MREAAALIPNDVEAIIRYLQSIQLKQPKSM
jgi:hypothetical protein